MQVLLEDPVSCPLGEVLTETKEKNPPWVGAEGNLDSAIHQHSHGTHRF